MSRSLLCSGLLTILLATVSAAGEPPTAAAVTGFEQMLREAMLLPADTRLIYQDEKGAALTSVEFAQRTKAGAQFDVARNDAAKTATLMLKAPVTPKSEIGAVTRLPPLDLHDLYGRRVRNLDLAGRPTLINFFFETCAPCIKEAPMLSAYRRRHAEFNYLAVTPDSMAAARRFVEQHKLDWPVAYDGKAFIDAAQVKGFPTYLLVAADGRILGRGSGMDMSGKKDPAQALGDFEKWVNERLPGRD